MSDPRCGRPYGYVVHVNERTPKCLPCRVAHAAAQMRYQRRRYLNHGPLLVDSTGTRRRLQALAFMGWSGDAVGSHLGVSGAAVRQWSVRPRVRQDTATRVAKLYDQLWSKRGPNQQSTAYARAQGWPPPLAWDDDTIDDPRARPVLGSALDRKAGVVPDEVAIQRAMRGYEVRLRPVERSEAVHRLTAAGYAAKEIARRIRIEERSVQRIRDAYRPQGEAS